MVLQYKDGQPIFPPAKGTCYTCGTPLTNHPEKSLWCNSKCRDKYVETPSLPTLARWVNDGKAKAVDGCRVEPDGICPHGAKSWLLILGII